MEAKILQTTGLEGKQIAPVVDGLAALLANYQVYYSNLRGFHWNIRGPQFYVLHEQFEKMYDEVSDKVDEIAERLLQLGAKPENRFSEYLKVAEVKEQSDLTNEQNTLDNVLETVKFLMNKERHVAKMAADAGDDVTADLMIGYLAEQEKFIWMLLAYLNK